MTDQLTDQMENVNLDEDNRVKFDDLPSEIKERIFKESFDGLGEQTVTIFKKRDKRDEEEYEYNKRINEAMRLNNEAMEQFEQGSMYHRGSLNAARFHYAIANKAKDNMIKMNEDLDKLTKIYYFHDMNLRYRFDKGM